MVDRAVLWLRSGDRIVPFETDLRMQVTSTDGFRHEIGLGYFVKTRRMICSIPQTSASRSKAFGTVIRS